MNMKRWISLIVLLVSSFFIVYFTDDSSVLGTPNIISILPPLIAISAAFILRQVIIALFLGIWFGAWVIAGKGLNGLFKGLLDVPQKYALNVINDTDHISIILITLFIGGMVGVISTNGGLLGLVEQIKRWANSRKSVQLSTVFMGFVIFFDDYANTLIIGNTMRSLTDKVNISREKLAYLVDATAAPLASIALISLWIGYEVGLIGTAIESIDGLSEPYVIFLNSIAYSFYPVLTLIFVIFIAYTGKDFGPMLTAEKRAFSGKLSANASGTLVEKSNVQQSSCLNALLPIITLIATVIFGILLTGQGNTITEILGSADSLVALLFGGFLGSIVAIIMTVAQNIQSLENTINSWTNGLSRVTSALVILVLSWALAEITKELNTANYLATIIGDGIYPALFPAVIFLLAGVISLGTGTSWGTMGILMPLVVPVSWSLVSTSNGFVNPSDMHIIYSSISCVLAGAVWGDHCSPISDTTILSSMASQCNHIEHVRTQMPYALVVGVIALLGTIATGFGLSWWSVFITATVLLWFGLNQFGQSCQKSPASEAPALSVDIRQP
ncbi:Na+/H+ antiporter NhaC family protein [Shewanella eurypsychrophilus]|uniref:Na+/H+ antiporter NhaC family protein n=1 Tax=Shewanella eurypsychrophilus TaxID=2593656 RepID=A0ABX6VA23_9GAMM|nr:MULTISPECIES: Na+/H+ antiporter NhaC family protein [Shewanella]QFU24165.1 Na+/H+ antiporter NhaC family protein [Shewanella sp. YLB-09]QPG59371.1 Na+/H+ antiporter NhaC family protein [Shewanella eurypsychrophilus]